MFWWVIWWHDGQSKRPLRQDKHGHYFLISHLLFVLQYFYHNFESCCWTIYTNRKIILHDVFVQLQSIFNSTNINHGQSYPIFGFWLKLVLIFNYVLGEACVVRSNLNKNRRRDSRDPFCTLHYLLSLTGMNLAKIIWIDWYSEQRNPRTFTVMRAIYHATLPLYGPYITPLYRYTGHISRHFTVIRAIYHATLPLYGPYITPLYRYTGHISRHFTVIRAIYHATLPLYGPYITPLYRYTGHISRHFTVIRAI